ncbi:MAG: YraN family protein [Treponema sp.]|nr:YraN family protein [Spirochaetia bacterium]MDD7460432.1 YraN family protein [Spirochaetales bacterium]MDY5810668.1 YraN family protein [Treponema sp.]MEE1180611.1 YraN family protein [Treponema sp.]
MTKTLQNLKNCKEISTRQKGNLGEDKACQYLADHGYQIVDRNYRIRTGEIDIIAFKDETLVFVEVKSLPGGTIETLAHELNSTKQKKIIKTSKSYLQKHRQYSNSYIRYDVLAIDVPGLDPVHHIVNAFSE